MKGNPRLVVLLEMWGELGLRLIPRRLTAGNLVAARRKSSRGMGKAEQPPGKAAAKASLPGRASRNCSMGAPALLRSRNIPAEGA